MTSMEHGLDARVEKSHTEQKEDVEKDGRQRQNSAKHGDRVFAIIGDERVFLTDEDVCGS